MEMELSSNTVTLINQNYPVHLKVTKELIKLLLQHELILPLPIF